MSLETQLTAFATAVGTTVKDFNFRKLVGTRIQNQLQTNLNSSTAGTDVIWDPASGQSNESARVTFTSGGVAFDRSGFLLVSTHMYFNATVTRANVGVRVTVNGTPLDSTYGASGYIRNSAGHRESSCHRTRYISYTAGDVIGVECARLAAAGIVTTNAGESDLSILAFLEAA